ncbi:hypothetical protein GC197_15945 [bacterium]|nr:hypothetical protein [bacterium]
MILPSKHLKTDRALIGIGGEVLQLLDQSKTVSRLWEEFRETRSKQGKHVIGFDRFVLTLDMLYLFEAIDFDRGRILRRGAS